MRKSALLLLLPLTLVLAACNSGQPSGNGGTATDAAQALPEGHVVTGSVKVAPTSKGPASVSADAKLEITLTDISRQPSLPVATQTIQPVGSLPASFRVDYKPSLIDPTHVIVIVAQLVDGERTYTMPLQRAVITKGSPSNVDITLQPQPTAAEKMLAAYEQLEGQLGGMKISQGTSRGDNGSRAWQIFKKNAHVQFVRAINDSFKTNARVKTAYAYQAGKPWVVIREHLPGPDAKPVRTERAGWDETGALVLHQVEADGKTSDLSTDAAAELYKDAEQMFSQASK